MRASTHRGSRLAAVVLLAALGFGGAATLAGCSGEGATTSCSGTSECTITFDRRADTAKVSILGVEVSVVSATDTAVTLNVAGQEVTVNANASTTVGGLTINVNQITDDEIVVKVTRS
ncbi:MAG: hypothetical protein HOV79_05725 [Hamadaea sp.]|nr:hypothetical protein [Hamadaea sp.]